MWIVEFRMYIPVARPPEHPSVAGFLPKLPVASVILDIFLLQMHVKVLDAAFSMWDLEENNAR